MFFDPHPVGETQSWESESDTRTEPSVRNLGVGALSGGAWALPSFSEDVPTEIGNGPLQSQYLAQLSLTLHQQGFKLPPEASFTNLSDIIKNQLLSGVKSRFQRTNQNDEQRLPLSIHVVHEDEKIHVIGIPDQNLDIYQLGPVFNKLEATQPGLGWYLASLFANCHRSGLTLYEPCRLGYLAMYEWFYGAETNEELFAEMYGDEVEFDIEVLRSECNVLPSDLFDEFDGRSELFFGCKSGKSKSPRTKYGCVKALLNGSGVDPEVKQIVDAMLRLQHACRRRKWEQSHVWHAYEDGEIDIGALAVVVWEKPDLTIDLMQYYEENAYNSGEGVEELFRLTVSAHAPDTFITIAHAVNTYADRLSALNHLLGFLPNAYVE